MANLSQRTGTTPVNTRISLANNTASNVQNFNGYDSQELIGHVFIDGTTDYRAAVKVTVVKNGAGVYEVAATDVAGDDISGSPIVTFSMSGSILQATLPNITGFSSAYIDYHLVSPKLNAQYPLSVDVTSVQNVVGTVSQSGGIPTGSIIESGTSNDWDYTKFADGTFIASKALTGLGPVTTPSGSGYFGQIESIGVWPFTVTGTPRINCYTGTTNGVATAMISGVAGPSPSNPGTVRLARFTSSSATTFFIQVTAIGRWY